MSRPGLSAEEMSDPDEESLDGGRDSVESGDSRSKKKSSVLCQELSSLVSLVLATPASADQQTTALQSSKWNFFLVFFTRKI